MQHTVNQITCIKCAAVVAALTTHPAQMSFSCAFLCFRGWCKPFGLPGWAHRPVFPWLVHFPLLKTVSSLGPVSPPTTSSARILRRNGLVCRSHPPALANSVKRLFYSCSDHIAISVVWQIS